MIKRTFSSFIFLYLISLITLKAWANDPINVAYGVFHDTSHQCTISFTLYTQAGGVTDDTPLAVLSPGYKMTTRDYSFLAEHLCALGYMVACLQNVFPEGATIPQSPPVLEKRAPFHKIGSEAMDYAITQLFKLYPKLRTDKILLVGHSLGGDIATLFATQHPHLISHLISLDSLRQPFPKDAPFPILHMRACNTFPDNFPIPSSVTTLPIEEGHHDDLCDHGPEHVKTQICNGLERFLNNLE